MTTPISKGRLLAGKPAGVTALGLVLRLSRRSVLGANTRNAWKSFERPGTPAFGSIVVATPTREKT